MKLNDVDFGSLKGNEITLRKSEELTKPTGSVLKKLDSIYDEHARLLFLFDVSGSMSQRVVTAKGGESLVDQYAWTPQLLAKIALDTQNAIDRYNNGMAQPGDEKYARLADPQQGPMGEMTFAPASEQDLKERIVRADLMAFLGVAVDFAKHNQQPPTRIELVKKLAKSEIANRFKKYPNSVVSVVPFSGHPVVLFDGQTPDNLWGALDTLDASSWSVNICRVCGYTTPVQRYEEAHHCGHQMDREGSDGGTDILAAIRQAVELCRKKPSAVGIHHVIVVTDGEDGQADSTIESWVPTLKQSGVVLDYIHIGDSYTNQGLKRACEALGGEYVHVNTEREFESRFIAAVNRLMLPPAATK